MHTRIAIVGVVFACGGNQGKPPPALDAALVDAVVASEVVDVGSPAACNDEIRFTQATGCQNDGSVEFCIPEGDPQLIARLQTIEASISCAGGGGRAGCYDPPGLLLCFYPTRVPAQCDAMHGAMNDETWQDMCEIAALPEVTEIVPTWFE